MRFILLIFLVSFSYANTWKENNLKQFKSSLNNLKVNFLAQNEVLSLAKNEVVSYDFLLSYKVNKDNSYSDTLSVFTVPVYQVKNAGKCTISLYHEEKLLQSSSHNLIKQTVETNENISLVLKRGEVITNADFLLEKNNKNLSLEKNDELIFDLKNPCVVKNLNIVLDNTKGSVKKYSIYTSTGKNYQLKEHYFPKKGKLVNIGFPLDTKIRFIKVKIGKTDDTKPSLISCSLKKFLSVDKYYLTVNNKILKEYEGKQLTFKVSSSTEFDFLAPSYHRFLTLKNNMPRLYQVGKKLNAKSGRFHLACESLGFNLLAEEKQSLCRIMQIRQGSLSSKSKLKVGDILLAIQGKKFNELPKVSESWFRYSQEAIIGRSILEQMKKPLNLQRKITLQVLRDSKIMNVDIVWHDTVQVDNILLPNSAVGKAIMQDLLKRIVTKQKADGSWDYGNVSVSTSFSVLALMGTGDKKYLPQIKRGVDFLLKNYPKEGFCSYWMTSFAGICIAEYYLATGDKRSFAWMQANITRLAKTSVKSSYEVQGFGHKPNHLPYSNQGLIAPTAHLLLFESLAQKGGIKPEIWQVLSDYINKSWDKRGYVRYNPSASNSTQAWSRTILLSSSAKLRKMKDERIEKSVKFLKKNHYAMRNSHGYGLLGACWGLGVLSGLDRSLYNEVLEQWKWHFIMSWRKNKGMVYSTFHAKGAGANNCSDMMTAGYAFALACSFKNLHLSGGTVKNYLKE